MDELRSSFGTSLSAVVGPVSMTSVSEDVPMDSSILADARRGVRWVTASAKRSVDRTKSPKYAHTLILAQRRAAIMDIVELGLFLGNVVENTSLEESWQLRGHDGDDQG